MSPGALVQRRRLVVGVLVVLLLALLAALAWVGWKGSVAVVALRDAQGAAGDARSAIARGDAGEGARHLGRVTDALARARAATQDPVWRAASAVPFLGGNLRAVGEVSAALDELSREGVAPVVEVVSFVASGGLAPRDSQVDVAAISGAAPALERAAEAGERAAARLADLDTGSLLPAVGVQVEEVRAQVEEVASALRTGARVSALLPPMLGAEGERRYLVLFLNSAELRSTGGLVGALTVLEADEGRLSMADTTAGTDLPRFAEPVLPLEEAELELHTEALGRTVQGVALTPDFPRTAELAAAMWREATGERVDGVIGADVVALAGVLEGTGPVRTADGTEISAENAVDVLLHESYLRLGQEESDAFFADAARRVFERVVSGGGDFSAVVDRLAGASREGRVLVWSRDAEEQAVLVDAGLSGGFLSGAAPRAGGVFLNDANGGKLDYFLDSGLDVVRVTCEAGGMRVQARLALGSRVPAQGVEDLPRYVTGMADVPAGTILVRVTVYGPEGGRLVSTRREGAEVGARQATEAGREANLLSVELAPGQTERLEGEWIVPAQGAVEVWSTPTTTAPGRLSVPGSCG